ncbi:MAG TPA: hypothetical protein VL137_00305 [Polyangiaceae bacterium]|nr:hypothetical protein [Polyangiaceae bacterium]
MRDWRRQAPAPPSFSLSGTVLAIVLFALLAWSGPAGAQTALPQIPAKFYWAKDGSGVLADFSFESAMDAQIKEKLSRGLPTTIVFTGLVYARGKTQPIATTVQTCRVTWHVWEEMYRVEITRSNSPTPRRDWTPTVTGVNRRCAQADGLLVADREQLGKNQAIFIRGTLQINPLSPEIHSKIKRWISRPARTRPVTAGNTLFSTFTGLFMQQLDDAERIFTLETQVAVPQWTEQVANAPPLPK